MKRISIKNYRSSIYLQLDSWYLRKEQIECVSLTDEGEVELTMTSGNRYTASGKDVRRILKELCFNERG